jgi:excinuclease ABC subunit A
MGPEGGDGGGEVVGVGTPEDIIENKRSYTGKFLKDVMDRRPAKKRPARQAAE